MTINTTVRVAAPTNNQNSTPKSNTKHSTGEYPDFVSAEDIHILEHGTDEEKKELATRRFLEALGLAR